MYLIIDDQRLACLRLKEILLECNISPDLIFFETDTTKALQRITSHPFDLIFLDIEMPQMSGFEFWHLLKEMDFKGYVIWTTAHDQYILTALREQALDYLLKPVEKDELLEALQRFRERSTEKVKDFDKLTLHGLSKRQIEIAKRIFRGMTSSEIADELFLSKHTVDTHRRNILRQTGCKNTTELFKLL